MSLIVKVQEKVEKYVSLRRLLTVILVLSIILLLNLTWPIWSYLFGKAKVILMPFIIGFGIAYMLRPIVVYFERYNIKRGISVPITFIVIVLALWWLLSSIFPSIYSDLASLVDTAIEGFQKLYTMYVENNNNQPSPIVDGFYQQVLDYFNKLMGSIPTLPALVSNFFGKVLGVVTTAMFSFIIGIYFIMDYERVSKGTLNLAEMISPKLRNSLIVINESVSSYLRTLVVIMGITFVEYGLFYFIVGHKYALVMGIITSLALLIPYVGGISANIFGFLTALGLSSTRLFFIFLGVMILPNVDSYVISPLVYSKRNKIEPLWSLFTFFAASTLFGFAGILLSTPIYFAIRSVLTLRANDWVIESE